MGMCIFKTEDIKRVVSHALQSKSWRMGYDYKENLPPAPAILFVHDSGVYCMSSGLPADMANSDSVFCAYAEGCDPSTDDDHWEESRFLVGGDDFVDTLLVSPEYLTNCNKYSEMVISVEENELTVSFRKPKIKKAV